MACYNNNGNIHSASAAPLYQQNTNIPRSYLMDAFTHQHQPQGQSSSYKVSNNLWMLNHMRRPDSYTVDGVRWKIAFKEKNAKTWNGQVLSMEPMANAPPATATMHYNSSNTLYRPLEALSVQPQLAQKLVEYAYGIPYRRERQPPVLKRSTPQTIYATPSNNGPSQTTSQVVTSSAPQNQNVGHPQSAISATGQATSEQSHVVGPTEGLFRPTYAQALTASQPTPQFGLQAKSHPNSSLPSHDREQGPSIQDSAADDKDVWIHWKLPQYILDDEENEDLDDVAATKKASNKSTDPPLPDYINRQPGWQYSILLPPTTESLSSQSSIERGLKDLWLGIKKERYGHGEHLPSAHSSSENLISISELFDASVGIVSETGSNLPCLLERSDVGDGILKKECDVSSNPDTHLF